MSNTNDFKAFAIGVGANVESPVTWAADPVLAQGFQAGTAPSAKFNTAWRQASSIATMIAQFTADFGPSNVQDDGDIAALEAQFDAALLSWSALRLPQFYVRRLLSNTTFYINASAGSDSNDGLSVGSPFQTINGAWAKIRGSYDPNGHTITLQLADGSYSAGQLTGYSGSVIIHGNPATPANVVINAGTGGASCISANINLALQYLELSNATATGQSVSLFGISGANLTLGPGLIFYTPNTNTSITLCYISGGATASTVGAIPVIGNSNSVGIGIATAAGGTFIGAATGAPATFTFSGGITFATAFARDSGGRQAWLATFMAGTFTGTRYDVSRNGVIDVNGGGANFFPGTIAGTTSSGGQYIP